MHHEWISPVAMCSIYCHPLEYFICNLAPVALGPIIAGKNNLVLSNKEYEVRRFCLFNYIQGPSLIGRVLRSSDSTLCTLWPHDIHA